MNPLDGYVSAVRAAVPALSPRRAGMLREIRDGLEDAVAAHRDEGMSTGAARRAAVTDFGSPMAVAAAMRAELAVDTARVAALATGVFSVVHMIIAALTWGSMPVPTVWPPWYGLLAQAVDGMAVAAFVAGIVLAGFLGRAPRWGGVMGPLARRWRAVDRVAVARWTAVGVLVVLVFQAASGILLTAYGPGAAALLPAEAQDYLHTILPLFEATLAVQCLRLTSGRRGTREHDGAHHTAEGLPFAPT